MGKSQPGDEMDGACVYGWGREVGTAPSGGLGQDGPAAREAPAQPCSLSLHLDERGWCLLCTR